MAAAMAIPTGNDTFPLTVRWGVSGRAGDRNDGSLGRAGNGRPAQPRRVHSAGDQDRGRGFPGGAARPPQHRCASEIRIEGEDSEEEIWADDLFDILSQLQAVPAFVGGSSSGSRVALLFALRHPTVVRGLLLCRVTGGPTAAQRLPENYYDQFIRAAEAGGMEAVSATSQYRERIAANPANRERLLRLDPADYLRVMKHWRQLFVAGAQSAVMGVSDEALRSIQAPAIVIPGNDRTHSRASGLAAGRGLSNAELFELPIEEQDAPLIPFEEWAPYEPEIARRFVDFMRRVEG